MQKCTSCGSTDLEEDRSRGEIACRDCGAVLEENMIVNEVQFQESAGGASTVIGQFVATADDGQQMPGFSASSLGLRKESRKVTLAKAKRRIEEVGSLLRMNRRQTEMAHGFYQSALNRGWTRGRQVKLVTAACLYIVCRLDGTSHMLLDLSDVLEVNVYTLGKTYMEMAKRLNIQIPALDPCLYIQRFASKMEFRDQTTKVESTAMRLMQRMKKDWISTGRRPSGLAAAALLVAARLHNFNRNYEDVARIARISQQTARKRLAEFGRTASSSLTIEEFLQVDFEEEHDPPAFYDALKKSKTEVEEKDMDALEEEIEELERSIDAELEKLRQRRCRMYSKYLKFDVNCSSDPEMMSKNTLCQLDADSNAEMNMSEPYILRDTLEGVVQEAHLEDCVADLQRLTTEREAMRAAAAAEAENEAESKADVPLPFCDTDGMAKMAFNEPKGGEEEEEEKTEEDRSGILDLTGIDDDELEREYILSKKEVIVKAREWYRQNADYVQFMKIKAEKEREQLEKEEAEGTKDGLKKKKRRAAGSRRKRPQEKAHNSAQEAIEAMLKEKKFSAKIDYEALRSRQADRAEARNEAAKDKEAAGEGPPAKVARIKAERSLPTALRSNSPRKAPASEGDQASAEPQQPPLQGASERVQGVESTSEDLRPVESTSKDLRPVESTSKDLRPVESTSKDLRPVESTSKDLRPVESTSKDLRPVESTSKDLRPVESTSEQLRVVQSPQSSSQLALASQEDQNLLLPLLLEDSSVKKAAVPEEEEEEEEEDEEEEEEEEEERREGGEKDLIDMLRRGRAQMGGFAEEEECDFGGDFEADGDMDDYYDDY